jgi:DNA-directed RNA polymerase specialized sigma24 family protein
MVGGDVAFARYVLADAVLIAWRERGFVEPETDARTWLYKLASRVCIEAVVIICRTGGRQVAAAGEP